ncbi:MAG: hypothetical protein PWQ57_2776 [Desulfovibrionales bacterium]|nr:hypothetical protein [Desulfovibrionales bacterium]
MTTTARLPVSLAWNAIALSLPEGWEISAMGKTYLQLDNGERPVMELKWSPEGANPTTEAGFRRLARKIRQSSKVRIVPSPAPKAWKQALGRFESRCFTWTGPEVNGLGAALFCPKCRCASVIQFMAQPNKADSKALLEACAPAVLSSYTDHEPPEAVVYDVYDLQARLPRRFALQSYAFQPGRFRLNLQAQGQDLELTRLAPASALLQGGSLADLARRHFKDALPGEPTPAESSEDFASFRIAPVGPYKSALMARAFRKKPFAALDVRLDREKDRILAVSLKSLAPWDEDLMRWVGERFTAR